MSAGDLLMVEGVSKRLGERQVLRDVSFDVEEGEVVLVKGPNGSGKTTLLRVVAGVLRPDSGRVLLMGRDLHEDFSTRKEISYCPERLGLLGDYTIEDNMIFFAKVFGRPFDEERFRTYLRGFQLEDYLGERVSKLSAGTKKKVAIARSLAFPAKVYLLDEPLANLDEEGVRFLVEEVRGLADQGRSFLISSHIEFPGADLELEMRGGSVVEIR